MWLSETDKSPTRRRVLSLLLAAPVAACGFTPALAPGEPLARLRNRIRFADPDSGNDFVLKSALEDRLGSGETFDLSYKVKTQESGVGITPDQVITRQQVDGTVEFSLVDRATDAVLLTETLSAFTSYGTTGTTASTAFAREAAYERLMAILADRIVSRLAITDGIPS